MIELKQISKSYKFNNENTTILTNQGLTIKPKSSVVITGPSGSGKSTILRIIAGLEPPNSGSVLYNKTNIYNLSDEQRAKIRSDQMGFIFQSFRLFPSLTVFENVQLACEISNIANSESVALKWINEVNLTKQKNQTPDTLSGGEQQRVAIARALATNPSVILADEPTGNLDQTNSNNIKELLQHCLDITKATLILVTHDSQLATMCDIHYKLIDHQLVPYEHNH